MTIKTKKIMIISILLMVCIILIGAIYIKVNEDKENSDIVINNIDPSEPVVDVIEVPEEESITVEVTEIKIDKTKKEVDVKVTEEVIDEPMAIEPKKPDNTLPEEKPETSDDVEDMTKEPEYTDEEVIYVPDESEEVDLVIEQITDPNKNNGDEENNLVPDSENPFLQDNIPDNGDGGEINGADLGDGEWGTGDKF